MGDRRKLTNLQRWQLAYKQSYRCNMCGIKLAPGWHADHVKRLAQSRDNSMANFQALCTTCHIQKTHDENCAPKKVIRKQSPTCACVIM